jgi:hypothetical protein
VPVAVGFNLAEGRVVDLAVHTVDGRRVAALPQGLAAPGWHELDWNGLDDQGRFAPRGVYLCGFHSEEGSAALKTVRSR